MDASSRAGWRVSAQLNLFTVLACAVPAIAILFLGWYAVAQPFGGPNQQTTLWTVTLSTVALTLLIVLVSLSRMRAVVRGYITSLADVARLAAAGDPSARAVVVGDDDYAQLAMMVNTLITRSTSAVAQKASMDAPDAAQLQAQIERLLTEVSAVGEGDLRVQAEVTPDTLGVLADSFNFMIEELAKVVGSVQTTANQVTAATRRLLDRSTDVTQASEAQARQISLASERVAQLADFVQLSATNALQAAEAAREALNSSREGQMAVVKTTEGMANIRENVQETSKKIKRLGERSQEVGEIVRLIEDIAEQTNLLALNATIQSAAAGENGRGFAVVADEIRILATRVADATKRVSAIVQAIQGDTQEAVIAMEESTQDVVAGSRLADEAGRSLQRIYGAVERQARMINDIARGANERRQVAESVAVAMNQIAEVTRQTNAITQDTMSAVSYLANLAEQLRASVATFRLPDHIAEAAGLQARPELPPTSGGLPQLGAPEWSPSIQEYPALPAGPISASYAPGPNAFDIGAYDATWTEGQPGGGNPTQPGFGPAGYGQSQYSQQEYGPNGYGEPPYPSGPASGYPHLPERG
jgi:methyl-accepting chemotaxis protein